MHTRILSSVVLAGVALFVGCGTTAPSAGRGLHWAYTPERLAAEGYPDPKQELSSREWGVLFDDEGIPYGPRSFFIDQQQQEHPYLTVTDAYLESRYVRVHESTCCGPALLGHYLEICDLAVVEISERLNMDAVPKLNVFVADDLDDWRRVSGVDFWVTHHTVGPSIQVQPVSMLFRRTLAGHTAYASIAEALLDTKTHGRIPRWLREGIASYLSEEGFEHLSFMVEFRARGEEVLMTPAEVERNVYPLADRTLGRKARYNAFLMVWTLSETYGWNRVQDLLDRVATGEDFEDAVEAVYGVDDEAWLALLDPTVNGEPTVTRPGHDDSELHSTTVSGESR